MRFNAKSWLGVTVLCLAGCGSSDDSGLLGGQGGAAGAGALGGQSGADAGLGGGSGSGGAAGTGGEGGVGGTSGAAGVSGASGAGGDAGAGGAVGLVGCADGTREAFQDVSLFPDIAGCDGGFRVPGVKSPESLVPQCGLGAGNTGSNAAGNGCSVADLCAEGWLVCANPAAVTTSGGSCTGLTGFWATRQSTSGGTNCSVTGTNNVVGCGNVGLEITDPDCAPLNRAIAAFVSGCGGTFNCGTATSNEAMNVTKTGPGGGGVLCCRL